MFQHKIHGFLIPDRLVELENAFNKILLFTERNFGSRNPQYNIDVAYLTQPGGPFVNVEGNNIHIVLSRLAGSSFVCSCQEFAHEIVHCLRPTSGKHEVTYLEEGVATYNEELVLRHFFDSTLPDFNPDESHEVKLKEALELFRPVYGLNNNVIRDLLANSLRTISSITADEIDDIMGNGTISSTALARLESRFY